MPPGVDPALAVFVGVAGILGVGVFGVPVLFGPKVVTPPLNEKANGNK